MRVSTLGAFVVALDDRPLAFPRKAQQKPLALLKALVAFGGRGVAEEQLVDALWPDAEGDAAAQALKTTLHRLRQLLGRDGAVLHQGGRAGFDPRACWLDTWAFERLLDESREAGRRGDTAAEETRLERALGLYRGPFLDTDARLPWTAFLRERLRSRFVAAVGRLGQRREAAGQWEEASELYERGLRVEDLAEEFYRRLMACQLRLGRRADAAAVYRRCREVLAAALGVAPSSETEMPYRAVRADP